MKGIAQEDSGGIHAGDLLSHSLDTLEVLESLLPAYEDLFSGHGRCFSRYLKPVFPNPVLKLAALLYDMGKPRCREVGADAKIHFYGHEEVGAEMADSLATRLRFSRRRGVFEGARPPTYEAAPPDGLLRREACQPAGRLSSGPGCGRRSGRPCSPGERGRPGQEGASRARRGFCGFCQGVS